MKISMGGKGFVKTAFEVVEKATGTTYDCFLQDYKYYHIDGPATHETRFNIGINGWTEWSFIHYVNEEEFNERYEIK